MDRFDHDITVNECNNRKQTGFWKLRNKCTF